MSFVVVKEFTPTFDWEDIDKSFVGDNVFRFSWIWNGTENFPGFAKLLIAQTYAFEGYYNFESILASKNKTLLLYKIPPELKAIGAGVYFPEFKLSSSSNFTVNGDLKVRMEQWDGPIFPVEGGEYD